MIHKSHENMDCSKKPIKNLTILTLFTALILLLCSWQPLTWKPSFSSSSSSPFLQKDELEAALDKVSMANKTLIITIINKAYVEPHDSESLSMFDVFLEGFRVGEETRQLLNHLLVVAMDQIAYERCEFRRLNCYRVEAEHGDSDGGGEKVYMSAEFIEMMWRRTFFVMDVLKRGYSFIFTDTDVLWLRNPFTRLMNNSSDLQISTDNYNGDTRTSKILINTGFYFIRSNTKTTLLFQKWYDMRNKSTGLKEQDVLVQLFKKGVIPRLNLDVGFLYIKYFSGFCRDSRDIESVVTVHANCCRGIRAKVADLKRVLWDWKRFKDGDFRNGTGDFRWSKHVFCWNSWRST